MNMLLRKVLITFLAVILTFFTSINIKAETSTNNDNSSFPEYSLEYLLSGYNIITLGDSTSETVYSYNGKEYGDGDVYLNVHAMGGALVRGDLIIGDSFSDGGISDNGEEVKSSFVNGLVPDVSETSGLLNTRSKSSSPADFYVGIKNIVNNEVNEVNGRKYINGYNNNGNTYVNNSYIDWEKLNKVVKSTSLSLADSVTKTININSDWQNIEVESGSNVIVNSNGNDHVKINITGDGAEFDTSITTVINILSDSAVSLPQVVSYNGTQFVASEEKKSMPIILNIPNATKVNVPISLTPAFGHVVAPNANIQIESGNYNGTLIGKSLYTNGEGHMWPYEGSKFELDEKETDLTLEGMKTLENREFQAGDTWSFVISSEDENAPLPSETTVTINPSEGSSIDFNFGAIKYSLADVDKTYTYTVKEEGNVANVVNDSATHTVSVTVSQTDSGFLVASATYSDKDKLSFVNKYQDVESSNKKSAKTGDISNNVTIFLTMVISLVSLIFVFVKKKKMIR